MPTRVKPSRLFSHFFPSSFKPSSSKRTFTNQSFSQSQYLTSSSFFLLVLLLNAPSLSGCAVHKRSRRVKLPLAYFRAGYLLPLHIGFLLTPFLCFSSLSFLIFPSFVYLYMDSNAINISFTIAVGAGGYVSEGYCATTYRLVQEDA